MAVFGLRSSANVKGRRRHSRSTRPGAGGRRENRRSDVPPIQGGGQPTVPEARVSTARAMSTASHSRKQRISPDFDSGSRSAFPAPRTLGPDKILMLPDRHEGSHCPEILRSSLAGSLRDRAAGHAAFGRLVQSNPSRRKHIHPRRGSQADHRHSGCPGSPRGWLGVCPCNATARLRSRARSGLAGRHLFARAAHTPTTCICSRRAIPKPGVIFDFATIFVPIATKGAHTRL